VALEESFQGNRRTDMDLKIHKVYKRADIHDQFGGTRQSGISPCKTGHQILIFSTNTGESHGYEDGWDEDNKFFYYTGAGQSGDQDIESARHNGRILHHHENGERIRLFTGTDKKGLYLYEADLSLVDFDFFQTHDTSGRNRTAIKFIFERLSDNKDLQAINSPIEPEQRPYKAPDRTSRKGLITTRVGQGYYRQRILERFNRKCAVTGADRIDILIASHIVPWRDASDDERLDVNNGILLSPMYDALFDKHLISFDDNGCIVLSEKLSSELKSQLKITGNETITVYPEMKKYLARHRAELLS